MAKVKNKDTNIELIIRKRLWRLGCRYRVNYKIAGSPDIAFPGKKVAIFCDGDFWHGKNYKKEHSGYKKFWKEKIAVNIERDKRVDRKLKNEDWKVLRFWKSEILKEPDKCVEKIVSALE